MLARYEGERLSLGLGLTMGMEPGKLDQWIGDRYDPRLWGWGGLQDSHRFWATLLVTGQYLRGTQEGWIGGSVVLGSGWRCSCIFLGMMLAWGSGLVGKGVQDQADAIFRG